MTFGEFRRLSWLKIDPNGYDILARPTKQTMIGWLKRSNIDAEDTDNLIEKVKQMSLDEKLYWEFVDIGSVTYLDVLNSLQNVTDFDDCEVELFDLQNFKLPTLFIKLDV